MVEPPREPSPTPHVRPRWVKASAVVAIVALVVLVIVLVALGHGPGRHGSIGGTETGGEREHTLVIRA
jgi:hypothetical protein